jgi:hypothetical protein
LDRQHRLTGDELSAMVGSTPFLSDTVQAMPTGIFVYLPMVLREKAAPAIKSPG